MTSLYDAINHHAQERPERTALSRGGERLAYRQLADQVDTLADRLRELGVRPESAVVIDRPVGFETVVAMAAVSAVGAAFTLLEPDLPDARKQAIIDDCRPSALVTEAGPRAGTRPGAPLHARLARRTSPAAYIGYTSGSTGTPKGAVIEEDALANHVRATVEHYALTADDKRLLYSSISFDLALEQICTALHAGCELAFRDDAFVYGNAAEFLHHVHRLGITVLSLPTGVFNALGAELPAQGPSGKLRLVMAGGEAPTPGAVAAWSALAPRIVNAYGPTETAVVVSYRDLQPGDDIAIGGPIEGVTFRPAPLGDATELVIHGVAVARGYLGAAAASQAFGLRDGVWSYRTGDLATARPDGGYDLHGRQDAQVKVAGGYRVEPGEITARLLALEEVLDAAVVPYEAAGGRLLAAYVRLTPDRPAPDLARHLAAALPDYMRPSRITALDAFPLTPRGKVDRAALTALAQQEPDEAPDLRRIWAQVLGAPPAGPATSFFEAGGTSVKAIELITRIRRTLGVELRAAELYRTPRFDALAALLADRAAGIPTAHRTTGTTLVPMRRAGRDRLWVFLPPLSGAVTRYAALSRLLPDGDTVWAMETPPELSGKGMAALAEGLTDALVKAGVDEYAQVCVSGYSLGGVFAYEVARRLHARRPGAVKALLLDPPDPGTHRVAEADAYEIFVRVGWSIDRPASELPDLAAVAEAAKDAGTLAREADVAEIEDAWSVYASNARILDGHTLDAPDGLPVRILQGDTGGAVDYARRGPTTAAATTRGEARGQWRTVVPDDRVDRLPVDHFALMEPPNDLRVRDWLTAHAAR